jgi:two-component system, NarL family, nitrate/nitrite response regulator NarL
VLQSINNFPIKEEYNGYSKNYRNLVDPLTYLPTLFILGSLLNLLLGFLLLRQSKQQILHYWGFLLLSAAFWAFGDGMTMISQEIMTKQYWAVVALIGRMLIVPFLLLFLLNYAQINRRIPQYFYAIIWMPFIIAILLAISNHWHRLIWADLTQDPLSFNWGYGRGFYLNIVLLFSYLIFLPAIYIMASSVKRLNNFALKQAILISAAIALPISLNIFRIFIADLPVGLNFASLGFILSALIFIGSLRKAPMLDLEPIYPRSLVDNIPNGIVAVNSDGYIIDLNKTAATIADGEAPWIGKLASDIFPFLNDVFQQLPPDGTLRKDLKIRSNPLLMLELSIMPLFDALDRKRGLLLFWSDITAVRQSEAELFEKECQLGIVRERQHLNQVMNEQFNNALRFLSVSIKKIKRAIDEQNIASALAQIEALGLVAKQASLDLSVFLLRDFEFREGDDDFTKSLTEFLRRFETLARIEVSLILPENSLDELLDPLVNIELIRIIHEAITNVYEHADAKKIEVIVHELSKSIQLIIFDNGIGFNLQDAEGKGDGLNSIKQAAHRCKGELIIHSEPNRGTHIALVLPKKENNPNLEGLKNLKILLIDNHSLMLDGLKSMLEDKGMNVVGATENAEVGLQMCKELTPDLVIMEIYLSGGDGIKLIQQYKQLDPKIKVVILSLSNDVKNIFAAKQSGADGYLLKSELSKDFFEQITGIISGKLEFGMNLDPLMVENISNTIDLQEKARGMLFDFGLSEVQIRILELIAKNYIYKEIAQKLLISESSVKYHVERILFRLDLSDRKQAVSYAYEIGLIPDRREQADLII